MSEDMDNPGQTYPELEADAPPSSPNTDDRPVSSQPLDWTLAVLRSKYERGQLDLQPRYQREYVWDLRPELPSRLIESLLLRIPVPPIYFGRTPGARLEVIDGQQRLTTLIRFVRNEFALQRLERMSSLNGSYFKDLPPQHQEDILDAPIHSVLIDAGSNANLRFEVFERLNRGAMALNEQELRNCVYRGDFCNLLADLEADELWRRVKGGQEPERRFTEREMILRFFAFADRIDHYAGNLKQFLNAYMGTHAPKDNDSQQIEAHAAMFRQTMRNLWTVFGPHSGRLYTAGTEDQPTVDGRWDSKFSVSAFDIQASALIAHPHAHVQTAAEQISEAFIHYLLSNPQIRLAISRRPAATLATRTRWFGFRALVQDMLAGTTIEPRFFSRAFRQSLFDSDPAHKCQLCGNAVHSFDDATVDHIQPYSRGGKTEPGNGQLAHRTCNARKCATIGDPWATSSA